MGLIDFAVTGSLQTDLSIRSADHHSENLLKRNNYHDPISALTKDNFATNDTNTFQKVDNLHEPGGSISNRTAWAKIQRSRLSTRESLMMMTIKLIRCVENTRQITSGNA